MWCKYYQSSTNKKFTQNRKSTTSRGATLYQSKRKQINKQQEYSEPKQQKSNQKLEILLKLRKSQQPLHQIIKLSLQSSKTKIQLSIILIEKCVDQLHTFQPKIIKTTLLLVYYRAYDFFKLRKIYYVYF
eukprot:TRINITY_DN12803_c0_g1_i1.p3 TRINITY_DN12803_c0_g1~~TRINITY_DN12803_c0_g1_i1.p3  ORF type:complete len:130 (-),score=1.31 TRINITY_DN12803_c0_g1_i1:310-699(-)